MLPRLEETNSSEASPNKEGPSKENFEKTNTPNRNSVSRVSSNGSRVDIQLYQDIFLEKNKRGMSFSPGSKINFKRYEYCYFNLCSLSLILYN